MTSASRVALMAPWFLPSVCLFGFLIAGVASDAPSAYLAFGFLPASVLSVLSILVSYWVERGTERAARWVWIVHSLTLLGLVVSIAVNSPQGSGLEASTILTYVVLVSAFPVSILTILVVAGIGWVLDHVLPILLGDTSNPGRTIETALLALTWLTYAIAGYWQWFTFFPGLVRRYRIRRG